MRKLTRALVALMVIVTVLTVPSLVSAWTIQMVKSDTDPGNVLPAEVSVGGQVTSNVNAGQTFTVKTSYTETCFNARTSSAGCPDPGTLSQTLIKRAYVMLHSPSTTSSRPGQNEWVYLYIDRVGTNPATFTAWAYSPYAGTSRETDTNNPRSQRLTTEQALTLNGNTGIAFTTPTTASSQIRLTRDRVAFTLLGVRLYRTGANMVVEWQLRWEKFPGGTMNVYQSVETSTRYDGWDLGSTITLRTPISSSPVPTQTPTPMPSMSPTAGPPPTQTPTPGGSASTPMPTNTPNAPGGTQTPDTGPGTPGPSTPGPNPTQGPAGTSFRS
ncbi:MAG: hypothetical protein HY329_08855 [Chloroflexi bacterium]|nr:hypothetical protein [Chloroflexota bacterium]